MKGPTREELRRTAFQTNLTYAVISLFIPWFLTGSRQVAIAVFAGYALFALCFNLFYFCETKFKSEDGTTPMLFSAIAVPVACFLSPLIGAWLSVLLVLIVAGTTHFLLIYFEPKGWVEPDQKF